MIIISRINAVVLENSNCGFEEYNFVSLEVFNKDLSNILKSNEESLCPNIVSLAIFIAKNYNENVRDHLISLYNNAVTKCTIETKKCLIRNMCYILYYTYFHKYAQITEAICRTNAEVNHNSYGDNVFYGKLCSEMDSKTENVKYLYKAIEINSTRWEVLLFIYILLIGLFLSRKSYG